jgi:hypothetical protein
MSNVILFCLMITGVEISTRKHFDKPLYEGFILGTGKC